MIDIATLRARFNAALDAAIRRAEQSPCRRPLTIYDLDLVPRGELPATARRRDG